MSSLPVPRDRHALSPSQLLALKKKVGSSGFHMWLFFSLLPPFCRSRSGSFFIPAQSIRAAFPPQTGQSHCSSPGATDGKYFLQPRSQSTLHQLRCCWEESGTFYWFDCLRCCVNDPQFLILRIRSEENYCMSSEEKMWLHFIFSRKASV